MAPLLLVWGSTGLQTLQQLLPVLVLLLGPRLATVVVVPLLLGYFLVWIEAGTHRETSRGLGAATGVVRVVGPIRAAACRLLPLLLLAGGAEPGAELVPAVTWLLVAEVAVLAELADCEGSK